MKLWFAVLLGMVGAWVMNGCDYEIDSLHELPSDNGTYATGDLTPDAAWVNWRSNYDDDSGTQETFRTAIDTERDCTVILEDPPITVTAICNGTAVVNGEETTVPITVDACWRSFGLTS